MWGAILGDVIGSVYEDHPIKSEEFPLFNRWSRFTDDTVLNVAIADALLNGTHHFSKWSYQKKRALVYAAYIRAYAKRYKGIGYGQSFEEWVRKESFSKQKSYGNGGAMRVIPIGYAYETLEEVLLEARLSCLYTHGHREAIRAAQAVAAAVFLAHRGASKEKIKAYLKERLDYPVDLTIASMREQFVFNSRASYSVPPALACFFESGDYEDAIRKAISLGGDSDTIACIAGGIAEAYYKSIPKEIYHEGRRRLDPGLLTVVDQFTACYIRTKCI